MSDVEVKLRDSEAATLIHILRRVSKTLAVRPDREARNAFVDVEEVIRALSAQAEAPASAGGGGVEAMVALWREEEEVVALGVRAYTSDATRDAYRQHRERAAMVRVPLLTLRAAFAARSPASSGEGQGDAAGEVGA